jgi:hypothetical protein
VAPAAAAPLNAREFFAALSSSVVYADASNTETNRKLWNEYAKSWSPDAVCAP